MKTTSILLTAVLLGGCAMGINHNIVSVNGKQYLAETKNWASPILPVAQWSTETTFKPVGENMDEVIIQQKITEKAKSCKSRNSRSGTLNFDKFYECLMK